jgi:6-phosphogluconolactonase
MIEVAADPEAFARHAALWIVELARQAEGRFAVCLSGGSTPRRTYQLLAQQNLPWERMHWFWGDERFVPSDDKDSNYRMAREAFLDHAPIPPENIHPIPTEGTPAAAARAYEEELQSYYGARQLDPARPLFDVQLLGLGGDGHTASLGPGRPELEERRRWVVEVVGWQPQTRITLTYPALESSRHTAFLVVGADKRAVLARALAGDKALPAARLAPVGELRWLVDKAARGGE